MFGGAGLKHVERASGSAAAGGGGNIPGFDSGVKAPPIPTVDVDDDGAAMAEIQEEEGVEEGGDDLEAPTPAAPAKPPSPPAAAAPVPAALRTPAVRASGAEAFPTSAHAPDSAPSGPSDGQTSLSHSLSKRTNRLSQSTSWYKEVAQTLMHSFCTIPDPPPGSGTPNAKVSG